MTAPSDSIPEVSPAEAKRLVETKNALIVDVREPDEWAEARIPGAKHLPLGQLPERQAEVPRDRTVVLQCRSGARSGRATRALLAAGYRDVVNLKGGIQAWAAEDLPLEHGAE